MNDPGSDTNGLVAALLGDLAAVQRSTQSGWGYKRAAAAVRELDRPLEALLRADGRLEKIPNVGPKSELVIREVLQTGASETVERAVAASDQRDEIVRRRGLRACFLSRSQVAAAFRDATLAGPSLDDYHGDLQMHSVWSDGSQTLEEIVARALGRGYAFSAITDHSHGLPIAGGVSMQELVEQHREIDRVNAIYEGRFRLIKGIEANIRPDGSVDMTSEELATLELVLAAPHTALRKDVDQTARMIAAVETPGVHILAHPRGRKFGERAGVRANWDGVFAAAAAAGVAIEIDGDPSRQDVDHTLARRALDAGCLFALDSDAHAADELRNAEYAIAHARLAGIPRERILNCWTTNELLEWLSRGR